MSVEETRAATELIKAAGGVGAYVAKVFGSIPEDALGLVVGDWLNHQRRRNLAKLEVNTSTILKEIKHEALTEPSPSVLIPLLQAAADESREELQSLWATLLANAMTDGGRKARRAFVEALKAMDPADAQVLDICNRIKVRSRTELTEEAQRTKIRGTSTRAERRSLEAAQARAIHGFIASELKKLSLTETDFRTSVFTLCRLGCIIDNPRPYGRPELTIFGRALLNACLPPRETL